MVPRYSYGAMLFLIDGERRPLSHYAQRLLSLAQEHCADKPALHISEQFLLLFNKVVSTLMTILCVAGLGGAPKRDTRDSCLLLRCSGRNTSLAVGVVSKIHLFMNASNLSSLLIIMLAYLLMLSSINPRRFICPSPK